MQDRTEPPPGYIVHDISTGPQCRRPWEFFAADSKVGRESREDAIAGAWEHRDAVLSGAGIPAVRTLKGPLTLHNKGWLPCTVAKTFDGFAVKIGPCAFNYLPDGIEHLMMAMLPLPDDSESDSTSTR